MNNIDKEKVKALRVALTLPDVHDSDKVVATWGELRLLMQEAVEPYRKDTERLDFIAKFTRCDPKMDGNHVWWPTSFKHRVFGPTLRLAIDAAIAAAERGGVNG